jgi:23S rRNA pseudouridine1911/1915/1917 synthase
MAPFTPFFAALSESLEMIVTTMVTTPAMIKTPITTTNIFNTRKPGESPVFSLASVWSSLPAMTSLKSTLLTINAEDPAFDHLLEDSNLDRLDRWLAERVAVLPNAPDLSRSRLKALILDGQVSTGGATITDPSITVKPDQEYQILVPPPIADTPLPQDIPLDIAYEDEHLIVVNKPSKIAVHPAPGSLDTTMVNALLAHCGDSLSGIGGVRRPGIVHRLDKDTTGLMVVAKSDEAHHGLVHQFAARTIGRSYIALVWGSVAQLEGRIEGPIGRSRRNRKKMAVTTHGGKSAATRYKTLKRYREIATLVECRLESGRTHQIRVHMTHIGHGLIGDPLYGGGDRRKGSSDIEVAAAKKMGRQALHANSLEFTHPVTKELVSFSSDMPGDFARLVSVFE